MPWGSKRAFHMHAILVIPDPHPSYISHLKNLFVNSIGDQNFLPPYYRRIPRPFGFTIEEQQWWYEIDDLNSERYLFLFHERDDILWLTIDEICGLAVVSYDTWDWQNVRNNT